MLIQSARWLSPNPESSTLYLLRDMHNLQPLVGSATGPAAHERGGCHKHVVDVNDMLFPDKQHAYLLQTSTILRPPSLHTANAGYVVLHAFR
jgi:hypothetical protein